MASRLAAYRVTGDADARRATRAAGVDLALAAGAAMLLWPFPLIRLTLGVPWSVHVPMIAVWVFVVFTLYLAGSIRIWGRTPAMYFYDLGLEGAPRPFSVRAAARWALGWTVAVVPGLLGARGLSDPVTGLPARLSGLRTASASPAEEGERER